MQKFAPLLADYGFTIPDPELAQDPETGRWSIGEIDWKALRDTQANVGPDSAARIATSRQAWTDTEWVRSALDAAARAEAAA